MDWALTFAAFVVGVVLGYVGRTVLSRNNDNRESENLVQQAQLELSQYKQEVADLYVENGKELQSLTEQLNRVNRAWNEALYRLQLDNEAKFLPIMQPIKDDSPDKNS